MSTTETIVAALREELAVHETAGKHVASSHCRQQIIVHETLARLRAEYETSPSDGLASQIRMWLRRADRDIDPPAPAKPKRRKPAEPEPEFSLHDEAA